VKPAALPTTTGTMPHEDPSRPTHPKTKPIAVVIDTATTAQMRKRATLEVSILCQQPGSLRILPWCAGPQWVA
jgi:hypothetical protein